MRRNPSTWAARWQYRSTWRNRNISEGKKEGRNRQLQPIVIPGSPNKHHLHRALACPQLRLFENPQAIRFNPDRHVGVFEVVPLEKLMEEVLGRSIGPATNCGKKHYVRGIDNEIRSAFCLPQYTSTT